MPEANLHTQCLLGVQCKDFTMIAADQTNTMSIIVLKNDEKKLHDLTSKQVMGIIGDSADATQITQFITKNLKLYRMKNGYQLNTNAVVHFIRKNVMESLKCGTPSICNMLVGGYDDVEGGQLYTVDFLASALRVPFGVHGFGGLLSMGVLDRYHRPTLSEVEAYELIKLCVHQIHERLFINLPKFQVKLVNKDGIQSLPTISPATFILENSSSSSLSVTGIPVSHTHGSSRNVEAAGRAENDGDLHRPRRHPACISNKSIHISVSEVWFQNTAVKTEININLYIGTFHNETGSKTV